MDPTSTAGIGGITAITPRRVFLSHTSDLGKHTEPGTFVAAAVEAVLRARHAVTGMAYFVAPSTSPAAVCTDMVAQSDVYDGIIGLGRVPGRGLPAAPFPCQPAEPAASDCRPVRPAAAAIAVTTRILWRCAA